MFTNQCSKCGEVFETKNPKRVICPNCLYPEGAVSVARPEGGGQPSFQQPQQQRPYYSHNPNPGYNRPNYGGGGGYGGQQQYQPHGGYQQRQPGYGPPRPQPGGYQQRQPGYGPPRPQPGGYQQRQPGYGPPRPQPGGYQQRQPGYGPPRPYGGPRPGGFGPPRGGKKPPKKLLINKEQLMEIEKLYKQALPLPNPDVHEVIAQQINLSPSKVFFGINLIREKMKLPKLEYPKRRLAVTPEQLMAIETLYEPYLPLPPLGIHKIISKQLRMDEWRVHVAVGLIRKNRNLSRWNEDREDLPPEMKEAQRKAREEKELAEKQKAQEALLKAASKKQSEAAEPEAPKDVEVVASQLKEPKKPLEAAEPTESKDAEVVAPQPTEPAAPALNTPEEPLLDKTKEEPVPPSTEEEVVEVVAPKRRGRKPAAAAVSVGVVDLPAGGEEAVAAPAPKKTRVTRAAKEK